MTIPKRSPLQSKRIQMLQGKDKTPRPASHFKNLKPKFSHQKQSFDVEELEDLFGETVIYLAEMGKMITLSNQSGM